MAMQNGRPQLFTPGKSFSSNEKDWAAEVGLLPWTTNIVFTKESFIRFLKTVEIEVGPNMSEIRKLPKFAQFGTMTAAESAPAPPTAEQTATPQSKTAIPTPPSSNRATPSAEAPSAEQPPSASSYRPTRKVRELPGGGSKNIASLFGGGEDEDEAASKTPEKVLREKTVSAAPAPTATGQIEDKPIPGPQTAVVMPDGSSFVPSRRVREPVGGFSSMSALLSGE